MSANLKTRTRELKRISLHELEKMDTSYFWVLNLTNPLGHLNLTVADGMGNQVDVRIPLARIPIDLSTQATKRNLVANPQIRTLAAKKVIAFVDPDTAVEFIERDREAADENRRLYALGDFAQVGESQEDNSQLQQTVAEQDGSLNAFAATMALGDGTDDEVIDMIRAREDELSKMDFEYIAANSKLDRVKAYAAERATSM